MLNRVVIYNYVDPESTSPWIALNLNPVLASLSAKNTGVSMDF
jgi:hypothetical protein